MESKLLVSRHISRYPYVLFNQLLLLHDQLDEDVIQVVHGEHGDVLKHFFHKINPFLNNVVLNSPKIDCYFACGSRCSILRLPFQKLKTNNLRTNNFNNYESHVRMPQIKKNQDVNYCQN